MYARGQYMPTTHPTRLERSRGGSFQGGPPKPPVIVAGVAITHPDRAMFPSLGFTKEALARYFHDVSPWMLPHVRGRPLTLVRAPAGAEAPVAIARHAPAFGPSIAGLPLRRVSIREKARTDDYLVADSAEGLVALAQLDVLEVHTCNASAACVGAPDRIVFDLDPGPGVAWERTVEAAVMIRALLARLGLTSFAKTTGCRGLHVVVPLAPRQGWDECLAVSRAVAIRLAQSDPRRFTASMVKSARTGRIYVDYLRNHRAASSIAEFSTRALRDAPVAAPVAWDELGRMRGSDVYTVETVLERVHAQQRDPWAGYAETKQRLRAGMGRAIEAMELPRNQGP
jgi:bifunctional non-homologous end joining protein LigD